MNGLSTSFRVSVMPVVVLLAVYGICGIVGNITVLYVYTFRYERNRFRCLVLAMGVVDLTSCLTTIPLEVISTWLWLNFPSWELCKVKSFFIQFTENSAIYILFVTAVYKYKQICKPLSTQTTKKSITISCAIGIAIAAIFASPSAVMWDINIHNLTYYNKSEIVSICEVNKDLHNTIYPTVYNAVLTGFALFPLAMMALYFCVARTTIQHYQRLHRHHRPVSFTDNNLYTIDQFDDVPNKQERDNSNRKTDSKRNSPTQPRIVETSFSHLKRKASRDTLNRSENTQIDAIRASPATSNLLSNRAQSTSELQVQSNGITTTTTAVSTTTRYMNRRPPASQLTPSRIRKVAIMVILAGTFSVTFFLALGIGYVFAVRDFDEHKSLGHLVIFFCVYRFYFINYCLNPLVYILLDGQFRRGVKELITCHVVKRSI